MQLETCQMIFTSLSPNTEKNDIFLAFKMVRRIILRKTTQNETQNQVEKLEEKFKNYLGVKHVFSFNSGRTAFLAILNSLNLNKDDEVLLQAFTCNAAVNPIIWSELKPVFVDIDETLNLHPNDLRKKITQKSRVVVVQHTFGHPAKLDEILEICRQHNLILIEDCAHSLGVGYNTKNLKSAENSSPLLKKVGTFGRAAFFSFGRDKVISSVYGGMAVTNDDGLVQKIKDFQEKCDYPSNFWILQQLLHPILTNYLIIPLYGFFGLGRWVLLAFQKLKILSKAVHKKEKMGRKPSYIPAKMPNALAVLALNQLEKLERFNSHRYKIAEFYYQNLKGLKLGLPPKSPGRIFMRFPVLIENKDTDIILKKTRKQKIFLDDGWRKTPIMPLDTDQAKMGYIFGSCLIAEKTAKNILNLPTHINISEKQAQKIVDFLKPTL